MAPLQQTVPEKLAFYDGVIAVEGEGKATDLIYLVKNI